MIYDCVKLESSNWVVW